MPSKLEITQRIVDQLDDAEMYPLDQCLQHWWVNLRFTGGMRLTKTGYEVFKHQAELESWEFKINKDERITKKMLLDLDRKLKFPYFLYYKNKEKIITFFSSQEAMMVNLYGNINDFLNASESRRPERKNP
jgi:hypothetical protein